MKLTEMGFPAPSDTDMGYDLVDDVVVHMQNNRDFYRRVYFPAMVEVSEKYKKTGKNDRSLATKIVDPAIESYCSAYNIKKSPSKLFTKEDREAILDLVFEEESDEIINGEYL